MTAAPRQRFTVERPDGFRFLVNVTLPPGYREGTRLPAMFWFYPREYDGQESYDERGRTKRTSPPIRAAARPPATMLIFAIEFAAG